MSKSSVNAMICDAVKQLGVRANDPEMANFILAYLSMCDAQQPCTSGETKPKARSGRPGGSKILNLKRDAIMRMVFDTPGLGKKLAKHLGLTHQAVSAWTRVPSEHVLSIAPLLNIAPEDIRPDVFGKR